KLVASRFPARQLRWSTICARRPDREDGEDRAHHLPVWCWFRARHMALCGHLLEANTGPVMKPCGVVLSPSLPRGARGGGVSGFTAAPSNTPPDPDPDTPAPRPSSLWPDNSGSLPSRSAPTAGGRPPTRPGAGERVERERRGGR